MLCVRCAHPLAPRADRCLRCFALNPQNRTEPIVPAPRPVLHASPVPPLASAPPGIDCALELSEPEVAWAHAGSTPEDPLAALGLSLDSAPPAGGLDIGALSVSSDEPPVPLELRLDTDPPLAADLAMAADPQLAADPLRAADSPLAAGPPPAVDPQLAVTEPPERPLFSAPAPAFVPAPAALAASLGPPSLVPEVSLALDTTPLPPAREAPAAPPEHPDRPSARRQLVTWSLDGLVLVGCVGLFALLAVWTLGTARLAPAGSQSAHSWADQLVAGRALKLAWVALAGALALAYSWLFAALGGRTPGMALTGLKLEREDGRAVSPARALARALLSLPSAAIGLFGFWLALLDPRGQTLHDKLTRSVIVRVARAG